MIGGVGKVVLEVRDQGRARSFWTERMGFELVQDVPYDGDDPDGEHWLEVRTPDRAVVLVLGVPHGPDHRSEIPAALPTSNVFFYADDLQATYEDLRARGVEFPQPPVQQPWGWWSMFTDGQGNRFALVPREL